MMAGSLFDCDFLATGGVISRFILGSVFILAGFLKALEVFKARANPNQQNGSSSFWSFVLRTLPILELFLGIWMLAGKSTFFPLLLTAFMFMLFTVYLILMYRKGSNERCACFGSIDNRPIGYVQIFRNVVLTIAALYASTQSYQGRCSHIAIWNLSVEAICVIGIILFVLILTYLLLGEVESLIHQQS
jgi:uncharacterized membrane protein YphA (DoxX/SURF4 family)